MTGEQAAFPTQMWDEDLKEATWLDGGLTKREYFAAMAMQGLLRDHYTCFPESCATEAVKYADALLAELEK